MEILMELCGWLGGVLLATCGLPQLWKSWKTKELRGVSLIFLLWWFLGEVFSLIYVVYLKKWPLLVNFLFNLWISGTLLWLYWKYEWQREKMEKSSCKGA